MLKMLRYNYINNFFGREDTDKASNGLRHWMLMSTVTPFLGP